MCTFFVFLCVLLANWGKFEQAFCVVIEEELAEQLEGQISIPSSSERATKSGEWPWHGDGIVMALFIDACGLGWLALTLCSCQTQSSQRKQKKVSGTKKIMLNLTFEMNEI